MPDFGPLMNSTGTTWKCGHARRSDLAKLSWSELIRASVEGRVSSGAAHDELEERAKKCRGCVAADKQHRKYIAGHIALLLIQVVLGCLWAVEAVR